MLKTPLISLTLSDNDLCSDFLEKAGQEMTKIVELVLQNCKITNKQMSDLAKQVREQRWVI